MKTIATNVFLLMLVVGCMDAYLSKPPKKDVGRADCIVRSSRLSNDTRLPKNRNGLVDKKYRWPNASPCYVITGEFSRYEQKVIRNALSTGYAGTCLAPIECITCCNGDYIDIINSGKGCWADAGRQGGRQRLNLGQNCVYRDIVIHEFLHSMGFLHQQSNPNRDDYVQIVEDNIDPDQLFNFDKYTWDYVTDFDEPYDYCSIMHYDECAFSKNGGKTIIPFKKPDCDMGNVLNLSPIDINKVNAMYNCSK